MQHKVLVLFNTIDSGFEEINNRYEVTHPAPGHYFTPGELDALPHDYDILVPEFTIPVTAALIDRYPNLKLIANYGVGYNNIDIAYAHSKGITVTNTPHSVTVPTAEHTLALLLSCTRRIAEWDRHMRRTRQNDKQISGNGLGCDLYGKTLGIIGLGQIGSAVARLAQAFGMRVLYNKRTRLSERDEAARALTYAPLEALLAQSDVVSLHTPYTPASHHLINKETLAQMKPGAILINASRGKVVDEGALVEALTHGTLRAAGLDVFEHQDEPLPELYALENVTIAPHVGTHTYECRTSMAREVCRNILGFTQGVGPESVVR